MYKKIIILTISLLILTPTLGCSSIKGNDDLYTDCLDNASTTLEMSLCISEEYDRCDNLLNKVYKNVIKSFDNEGQEKLKKAQRAWISFRDLHCEVGTDSSGSASRLRNPNCKIRKTTERIKELQEYLDNKEGVVF